jgi:predicted CoA-binding protein
MDNIRTPITLVLGASENPLRYSHRAVRMLQEAKLPIVAVGRREGDIEGTPILTGMPELADIDTITLYVGALHQEPYKNYILSLKPRRVLFNPGTENPALEQALNKAGIATEHACTLVLLGTGQYLD